ncbi:MAG: methyltransferase domain-containing protein [Candidatus Binatia bacterium]|nr:methyltransferase domain-containing protein [Candidatus Binatia bacterium]
MHIVNTDQAEYWNSEAGEKWVRYQRLLDAQIGPLGREAMDLARVSPGERVVDVGCGCGHTSIELAQRVSPGGHVLGIDLSTPMLDRARERADAEGVENVTFVRGDAQSYPFPPRKFDLVFSRFGVMFFADAVAAFRNLLAASRPGARLAFVCWQAVTENPWMAVPLMAALQHLPNAELPNPDAPGPFAFADADKVRRILSAAGYENLEFHTVRRELLIGAGEPLEGAVEFLLQMGPTGKLLKEADGELRRRVAESVREALKPYETEDGVRMLGTAWIVTAIAPR